MQKRVDQAEDFVKDKAPDVAEFLADGAKTVVAKVSGSKPPAASQAARVVDRRAQAEHLEALHLQVAMSSASGQSPKRSLFKLLGDVPGLIVDLFRQEIENLKQELVDKVKHAGVGVGLLAGAGVVALFLLGTLILAGIYGLATVLPMWASALIVAGALLLIVLILVLVGMRQLKASGKPIETIDSIKTDVQVIKEHRSRIRIERTDVMTDSAANAKIKAARAELEDTLDAIEDKLNVPKQVSALAERAKSSYEANPVPWIIGAVVAAVGVAAAIAWAVLSDDD